MQIGCCWFDLQRQEMIDQSKGQVWHLNNEECQILRHLVKNQNKVVSKQKLLRGLTEHLNAELELADIIYKIREFLGPQYAPLLETVADQGYLLHSQLKSRGNSLVDSPFQSMSVLVYMIFTSIILILMFWIYSEVDHPYSIDSYFERTIYTQSKQPVDFEFYPANKNQKLHLTNKINRFVSTLQTCQASRWNLVSMAVSLDNRLINIILLNNKIPEPEFKNIKVISPDLDFSFLNRQWLLEHGICE